MFALRSLNATGCHCTGVLILCCHYSCGKTTICQLFASLWNQKLFMVNCHMHSESADFLGGLRPVRHRGQEEQVWFLNKSSHIWWTKKVFSILGNRTGTVSCCLPFTTVHQSESWTWCTIWLWCLPLYYCFSIQISLLLGIDLTPMQICDMKLQGIAVLILY